MEGVRPDDEYVLGWRGLNTLLRRGYSWSGRERHCAFLATETPRFADVSAVTGLDLPDDGRATARIDWDADGDLDLLVTSRSGPRVRFLRNELVGRASRELAGHRSVSVLLRGPAPNTGAVGARLELDLDDGRTLVRGRRVGEGYLAQSSAWVVFGLGPAAPVALRVRWPDGRRTSHAGLSAGGRFVVAPDEPTARLAPPLVSPSAAAVPPLAPPPTTARARVLPLAPIPMPPLALETANGRAAKLFALGADGERRTTGRPLLLVLWASWCAPCAGELAGLAQRQAELAAAGLDVLALSVDEPEDRAAASELLERVGWPYSRGFASPEAVESLDVLRATLLDTATRLPIPASFLVDPRGSLVCLTSGPLDLARLADDLALLDLDAEARRDRAVPFPGRWRTPPAPFDPAGLRAACARRGLAEAERAYGIDAYRLERRSPADLLHAFALSKGQAGELDEAIRLLEAAIAADPEHFAARADLGTALQLAGRSGEAALAYERALRLRPDDAATCLNLGLAQLSAGQRAEAVATCARLAELDPGRAQVLAAQLERVPAEDEP